MRTREEILAYKKTYRRLNREKINAYERAHRKIWTKERRDKVNQYKRQYRRNPLRKEQAARYARKYLLRMTAEQREKQRARQKEYRRTHPHKYNATKAKCHQQWIERNREKQLAHNRLARAIRTGKIVRPKNCQRCGIFHNRLHGHHHNYERALEVEWICPQCHFLEHEEKTKRTRKHMAWKYL